MALMMMTVILAMAFGLSAILFSQIKTIREIGYSAVSLYAADTGIERELFEANPPGTSYSGYLDLNKNGVRDSGDSFYEILVISPGTADCPTESNLCIRSVGTYRETRRAIQVSR